jgi:predicted acyltransferase
VLGSNPITAYAAPILVKAYILQGWSWIAAGGARVSVQDALIRGSIHHFGAIWGGLVYTGSYVAVWWLVMYYLYRRGLFLRV